MLQRVSPCVSQSAQRAAPLTRRMVSYSRSPGVAPERPVEPESPARRLGASAAKGIIADGRGSVTELPALAPMLQSRDRQGADNAASLPQISEAPARLRQREKCTII